MKNSNRLLFFILPFLLSTFQVFSQNETENKSVFKFIGIEAGSVFYESEFANTDMIRKQDNMYYPPDIYNNTSMNNLYFGAKTEFRLQDYNLGIQTGIRFSSINSCSGNKTADENTDFFYFLFKEEETSVEYLRLQGIRNNVTYIGIPIEIRYFMINSDNVRLFCKAATELQYQISSKSDVYFLLDEMNVYENDVIDKFDKSNEFLSTLYFSGGVKFGKSDKINLNIEAVFLSFILTNNNSIMNKPNAGGGFQINVQLPF